MDAIIEVHGQEFAVCEKCGRKYPLDACEECPVCAGWNDVKLVEAEQK